MIQKRVATGCRSRYADGMYLVEFFLPTHDNEGIAFPNSEFTRVRRELTEKFGGVTAFLRSPAAGLWEDEEGQVRSDDLVSIEVMTDSLDRDWWRHYQGRLRQRFRQQEILMRALSCEALALADQR
jgi:hypothetical protein